MLCSHCVFGQNEKSIMFYEIDDKAMIFVDGIMVYESDEVGHIGTVEIEVDLSKYIKTGEEEITVEIINIYCAACTTNYWSVAYEVMEGEESMDYQANKGHSTGSNKAVFSYSFYWNDL